VPIRTRTPPGDWRQSSLRQGDAAAAVAPLRVS